MKLTLVLFADEASLLEAAVVVPFSVLIHFHAVLSSPVVSAAIRLALSPVGETQSAQVSPGPAI